MPTLQRFQYGVAGLAALIVGACSDGSDSPFSVASTTFAAGAVPMPWAAALGTPSADTPIRTVHTRDGGMITGLLDQGAQYQNTILVKTDARSRLVSQHRLAMTLLDLQPASDGNYLALGRIQSAYVVARVSDAVEVISALAFQGGGRHGVERIAPLPDGGFVLVGYQTLVAPLGDQDFAVAARYSADGSEMSRTTLGFGGDEEASIRPGRFIPRPWADDSVFVATASVREHGIVIGRDEETREILSSDGEAVSAPQAIPTSDGGLLIAAMREGTAWVVKLAPNLDVAWHHAYDLGSVVDLVELGPSEYALLSTANETTGPHIQVTAISGDGNVLWARRMGGAAHTAVAITNLVEDRQLLVTGSTSGYGAGGEDALLLRLTSHGQLMDSALSTRDVTVRRSNVSMRRRTMRSGSLGFWLAPLGVSTLLSTPIDSVQSTWLSDAPIDEPLPIIGTPDSERLDGTPFGDEIDGQGGDDDLHGHEGNDLYVMRNITGITHIFEEGGIDTLTFVNANNVTALRNGRHLTFFSGPARVVSVRNHFSNPAAALERVELFNGRIMSVEALLQESGGGEDVVGTANADRLQGTAAADRLEGRAGADRLDGRGGDDLLNGGADDDTFTVRRGDGDDTVVSDSEQAYGGFDILNLPDHRESEVRIVTEIRVRRDGEDESTDARTQVILSNGQRILINRHYEFSGDRRISIGQPDVTKVIERITFRGGRSWDGREIKRRTEVIRIGR